MAAVVCSTAVLAASSSKVRGVTTSRKTFAPVTVPHNKPSVHRHAAISVRQPVVSAANMSTVKIVVQGRHLQVTDAIKEYAESKVSKVCKFP